MTDPYIERIRREIRAGIDRDHEPDTDREGDES